MSRDVFIFALDGIEATRSLESLPTALDDIALKAVNAAGRRFGAESRRRIRKDVAFSASYLTGTDGTGKQRLSVNLAKSRGDPEARITGRERPTMLARFVQGSPKLGKQGVTVQVAPGFARFMKRAFMIRLPAGKAGQVETKYNEALAVRLKAGEDITQFYKKKYGIKRVGSGLYILYSASVAQVFAGVAEDLAPEASDYLQAEYDRLVKVFMK